MNAEDAAELLSVVGSLTPGGTSDEWIMQLYGGLRAALRVPSSKIYWNTKFVLSKQGE